MLLWRVLTWPCHFIYSAIGLFGNFKTLLAVIPHSMYNTSPTRNNTTYLHHSLYRVVTNFVLSTACCNYWSTIANIITHDNCRPKRPARLWPTKEFKEVSSLTSPYVSAAISCGSRYGLNSDRTRASLKCVCLFVWKACMVSKRGLSGANAA